MFDILSSVAGPVISGLMGADSAEDAVNAQGQASAAAIAEQRRQYDQGRADLAPWRNVGGSAMYRLGDLLGLGGSNSPAYSLERYGNGVPVDSFEGIASQYGEQSPAVLEAMRRARIIGGPESGMRVDVADSGDLQRILSGFQMPGGPESGSLNKKFTLADFWDDPVTKASFQFGLDEGTKALDRMSGARGMRNSGQTLKALTKFGTDYTGQKAGESYNRFYGDQDRIYNRLAGVAGSGQTAAQNTASMGQGMANNVSSLISGQGNARGAAAIAGGNAWGNAANSVSNYFGQQSMLDKILNRGGAAGRGYDGSGWQEGFVW